MKIGDILNHIDSGHMALPEFQRGYVWNGEQVRKLFRSMYLRRPVGGLLVWATEAKDAHFRGDGALAGGIVKLLLDGQQRITSLYGVVRGKAPRFFDGDAKAFTGLRFHLGTEAFEFYQPVKMKDDPLWIDVSDLFRRGSAGLGGYITAFTTSGQAPADIGSYVTRLGILLGITDIDLHVEEVTGADKTLDVVVDIFNQVNSGGTKLSKGDLALAKICAEWPEARETMKKKLKDWHASGYDFNLDWLLRSVNTVLTGEALFSYLDSQTSPDIQEGLAKATKHIDASLNMIAGRLGLDHDRVLFGRYAIPVMVRYLSLQDGSPGAIERDKLLFWFAQAGMWGRFSTSTETSIDKELAALEGEDGGVDALLTSLRLWHGGLLVEPGHFNGWSLGAKFYPILYMLTRMGEARDWGTGLPLKSSLLGKMSRLEVHHIFPKAQLYKRGHSRPTVNALANFCFLTKDTNLNISDRLPEKYFPEIESKHPGTLASQWIPEDTELWKIENYPAFLEGRKSLLAAEANRRFAELLHGEDHWLDRSGPMQPIIVSNVIGGITSEDEERTLEELNDWVEARGLQRGEISFDHSDIETGAQIAVFDLAWPDGLQTGLTSSVAVLIDESADVLGLASAAGYRCFTSVDGFRNYVEREVVSAVAAE